MPPQLFDLPLRDPSGGQIGVQQLPLYVSVFAGQAQTPPQPSAIPARLPSAGQLGEQQPVRSGLAMVPAGQAQTPPQLSVLPASEPSGGQMGVQQLPFTSSWPTTQPHVLLQPSS